MLPPPPGPVPPTSVIEVVLVVPPRGVVPSAFTVVLESYIGLLFAYVNAYK